VQELFHRTARTVAQRYYGTLRFVSLDVVTELLPVEALESLDRLPAVLLYRAGDKSSPRIYTAPWRSSENLQGFFTASLPPANRHVDHEPCVAIEAEEEVSEEGEQVLQHLISMEASAGADGAALGALAREVRGLLHAP
jgi:hypothetical protein